MRGRGLVALGVAWAIGAGAARAEDTHNCVIGDEAFTAQAQTQIVSPYGTVHSTDVILRWRGLPVGYRPEIQAEATWRGARYSIETVYGNIAEARQIDPPGPAFWMRFSISFRNGLILTGPIFSDDKFRIRCVPL